MTGKIGFTAAKYSVIHNLTAKNRCYIDSCVKYTNIHYKMVSQLLEFLWLNVIFVIICCNPALTVRLKSVSVSPNPKCK